MSFAAIVGSAFERAEIGGRALVATSVCTPFGDVELHRLDTARGPAWLLFRHGAPHRWLPHQIPYRAHALALREVGCQGLLVTSSAGVLDGSLPLYAPLLVSDILFADNRLPDGSACSVYTEPEPDQGHLVLEEGLISDALSGQVRALAEAEGGPIAGSAVFAHMYGPRTKTAAENRALVALGAQVNSMTVSPEVVLANELEIPTVAVVIGHKYSGGAGDGRAVDRDAIARSLEGSRAAVQRLVLAFLERAETVPFGNYLYRFED